MRKRRLAYWLVLAVLAVGMLLVHSGSLSAGRMVLGVTAVFGSFGPVIAVSALPANLNQTFASGERILRLLEEQPEEIGRAHV